MSEAQHVIDAAADQMWQGIIHEPGFLLREWGGGQPCHIAVLFLMDHEQRVERIIHRGDLPSVWRAPKPQRPRSLFVAADEASITAMFDIVEWKVRNVYAWLGVASHYLPGYPHDNQFMVRFAAGLYEIPPPATTENQA